MDTIPLLGSDGQMPETSLTDIMHRIKEFSNENFLFECKKFSDYKVVSTLRYNRHSYLVKVENKETEEEYVLKKLKYAKNKFSLSSRAIREAAILCELKHDNIIAKEGFVVDNLYKPYILLEYCDENLTQLLKNSLKLDESEIKCLLQMLLNGLSYLYDNTIMHRDICSDNLLIHSSGILKIGDFGKARYCEKHKFDEMDSDFPSNNIGTPGYRAPELILNCKEYTAAVDMWSFGSVFAELLNHQPIFSRAKRDSDQMNEIIKLCGSPDDKFFTMHSDNYLIRRDVLLKQKEDTFIQAFPNLCVEGIQLLKKCFEYNWDNRVVPENCLNDKYFDINPLAVMPEDLVTYLAQKRMVLSNKNSKSNERELPFEISMHGPDPPLFDANGDNELHSSSTNATADFSINILELTLSEGEIMDSS